MALPAVDIAMIGVLVLSLLVGLWRGFTFELLSLAGWFVAWFAAVWLGPLAAPHLPVGDPGSALNRGAAFASAFVVVLVLWSLLARGVSALIGATPLRPLDRLLGAAFGLLRGLVVLLAAAAVDRLHATGRRGALAPVDRRSAARRSAPRPLAADALGRAVAGAPRLRDRRNEPCAESSE